MNHRLSKEFAEPGTAKSWALISIALLIPILARTFPDVLRDGEELYWQLAHRRVEPEFYGPNHAIFDSSNARFLFEIIVGPFVKQFGFDVALILIRAVAAALLAISIAYFLNSLSISIFGCVAVLALFLNTDQFIIAGEWIFGGTEPKVAAYICVFFMLGFMTRHKLVGLVICGSLATYFHLLVGGFWLLVAFCYMYIETRNSKLLIKPAAGFFLLILPLIIVVLFEQFVGALPSDYDGVSTNRIYQQRVSHHVAPFESMNKFMYEWSSGILAVLLIAIFLYLTRSVSNHRTLHVITLGLFVYLLIVVVVSYFDRETGYFAKFYLFRSNSLSLFLFITLCIAMIEFHGQGRIGQIAQAGKQVIVLLILTQSAFLYARGFTDYRDNFPDGWYSVEAQVHKLVSKDSVILVQPSDELVRPYVAMPRRLQRQTLVSWKFNTTRPVEIVDWDDKLKFRKSLFEQGCNQVQRYRADFLLVLFDDALETVSSCGDVIWSNPDGDGHIMKMDNRWKKQG